MSAEHSDFDNLLQNEAQRIGDAVRAIVERHALIDQAKGILMFVYGIDADEAFELLRWQSQHHNVKVFLIAEQIMKDLTELSNVDEFTSRLALNRASHRSPTHHRGRRRPASGRPIKSRVKPAEPLTNNGGSGSRGLGKPNAGAPRGELRTPALVISHSRLRPSCRSAHAALSGEKRSGFSAITGRRRSRGDRRPAATGPVGRFVEPLGTGRAEHRSCAEARIHLGELRPRNGPAARFLKFLSLMTFRCHFN